MVYGNRMVVCVCVGGSGIQHMGLCFSTFPLVPGPRFPQNSFSYRQWYGPDKAERMGMHTEPRCLSVLHHLQKCNTTAQITATSTKHLKARSWNASKCHTFLFFLLPLSILAFPSFFLHSLIACLDFSSPSSSHSLSLSLSLSLLLW